MESGTQNTTLELNMVQMAFVILFNFREVLKITYCIDLLWY